MLRGITNGTTTYQNIANNNICQFTLKKCLDIRVNDTESRINFKNMKIPRILRVLLWPWKESRKDCEHLKKQWSLIMGCVRGMCIMRAWRIVNAGSMCRTSRSKCAKKSQNVWPLQVSSKGLSTYYVRHWRGQRKFNKMIGETPDVRSDKRKPKEDKEEREDAEENVPKMSPRCPQDIPKISLKES